MVRVPGASKGTVSALPATIVDLAPTILDLARVPPGRLMDGRSFAPALHGRSMSWRNVQLIQTGSDEVSGAQAGWDFRGVWTRRYTYMRRVSDGAEFQFDRDQDPFELVNLVTDARYGSALQALRHRHDRLIECSGASCDRSFAPLPPVR